MRYSEFKVAQIERMPVSDPTLTIGARQGSFPGMRRDMVVRVVLVRDGFGVGGDVTPKADQVIKYDGNAASERVIP